MPPVTGEDATLSGIPAPSTFGVWGDSLTGDGVLGTSQSVAVRGISEQGTAVFGRSQNGVGAAGRSAKLYGVSGNSDNTAGVYGTGKPGVLAVAKGTGKGAHGKSTSAAGVYGESETSHGVQGLGKSGDGVHGESDRGRGVYGSSVSADGVRGKSTRGVGVRGDSTQAPGVRGESNLSYGVAGYGKGGVPVKGAGSQGGVGVYGQVNGGAGIPHAVPCGVFGDGYRATGGANGVLGISHNGVGVFGQGVGVAGVGVVGVGQLAGAFYGNASVTGTLYKGFSLFRIDHPLDPKNLYLNHAAVEAPDYKTFYDGVVSLNHVGRATVRLPRWFQALNAEFRYQLTPIGGPAPDLHVAKGVKENHFEIAGGTPGLQVSWQVTAVRQDANARANPLQVEERKRNAERGTYLNPEAHGVSAKKGLVWARYPELSAQLARMARASAGAKPAARKKRAKGRA